MAHPYLRTSLASALALSLVLLSGGCARQRAAGHTSPTAPPLDGGALPHLPPEPTDELTKAEALAIARQAVAEREGADAWPHGGDYRYVRRNASGETGVIVWRIHSYNEQGRPMFAPDDSVLILIDDSGRVIRYGP